MERIHIDFQTISHRFYAAVDRVMHADATAMLALWSERDDITYCDPYAHIHTGRKAIVSYWQQAAVRNSQDPGAVSATAELLAVQDSNEIICMVLREHIHVSEPERIVQIQALATNIYRFEEQEWRMIHRHAGTPSPEESS